MQRMLGGKRVGRMVDHVLGFVADGQHAMRAFLDSHNGRLVDHNALARDGDQGIAVPRSMAMSHDIWPVSPEKKSKNDI